MNPHLQALLMYAGVIGTALSQSVYSFAADTSFNMELPTDQRLVLVLLVQVVPTLALVTVRAVLGRRRRILDTLVFAACALWLLRQAQLFVLPRLGGVSLMLTIVAVLAACGIVIAVADRKHLVRYMVVLGILSPVLAAYFVMVGPQSTLDVSAFAAGGKQITRRADAVVILVMDELSLEAILGTSGVYIDAEKFPHLARFSKESVWFREARANYPQTNTSLSSAFSGTYARARPTSNTFDVTALPRPNLVSTALDAGYRTAFYSRWVLCSGSEVRCVRYRESAAEVLYRFANYHAGHRVANHFNSLAARAHRFEGQLIADLATSELVQPGAFSILHLLVSHHPYVLSEEGEPVDTDNTAFEILPMDETSGEFATAVAGVKQRYVEQLAYFDRQLGAFMRGMDATDAWGRTTVVLTADHGTCWVPGCVGRERIRTVAPSLSRVLMMIRSPLLAPRTSDDDYQHIDFPATVLDAAGLNWQTGDGRSALLENQPWRTRTFLH